MGNCCIQENQNHTVVYSTKALMNMKNFNGLDLYFSTQGLSRLQGECLVVFCDKRIKINKGNLAQKISRAETRMIKQNIEATMSNKKQLKRQKNKKSKPVQSQKMSQSRKSINGQSLLKQSIHCSKFQFQNSEKQYILIPIDIPTIKFKQLCVIFIEPWSGKSSIKMNLGLKILSALKQIQQKGISFIAIVQFDQQFGIPVNLGAGILARSIFACSQKLKIVTICNRNIPDQLSYTGYFQNFKDQLNTSIASKQSVDSNYF